MPDPPNRAEPQPFPRLTHLAPPGERNVTLRIDRSGERALRRGHPWLFAEGVREQSHDGRPGDFGVVFDRDRRFLAIGLVDPTSPIRLRVLHRGKPRPIDDAFFAERIADSVSRRDAIRSPETNAYRVVHGENDGLPGLVVDRYADTLVVRLDTPAWVPHLRRVLAGLQTVLAPERMVLRLSRSVIARGDALDGIADGDLLHGPALEEPIVFLENGLRFECDPIHGQKTGFFLDQRDNRARVEAMSKGSRVLNVFAYTGGFSVYAARGGAEEILSVDQSRPALAAAERNFHLNANLRSIANARHETSCGDAFEMLPELERQGRRFDVVILDPPSFARRKADIERALHAYGRLTRLGLGVLRRGGMLVQASCSARIEAQDFHARVHEAARRAGRSLVERARTGHPLDHPVGFEQGAYLKCLYAQAP